MNVAAKIDPREIRQRAGLNQSEFWSKVGVTQSGGSRYESGRNMPRPVAELVRLVYLERLDLTQISGDDVNVALYLKEHEPAEFRRLKAAAKASLKKAA